MNESENHESEEQGFDASQKRAEMMQHVGEAQAQHVQEQAVSVDDEAGLAFVREAIQSLF